MLLRYETLKSDCIPVSDQDDGFNDGAFKLIDLSFHESNGTDF